MHAMFKLLTFFEGYFVRLFDDEALQTDAVEFCRLPTYRPTVWTRLVTLPVVSEASMIYAKSEEHGRINEQLMKKRLDPRSIVWPLENGTKWVISNIISAQI